MDKIEIKKFHNIEKHIPKNQMSMFWMENVAGVQFAIARDIACEYFLYVIDHNKCRKLKQSRDYIKLKEEFEKYYEKGE
jgi:hypothetical protein